MDKFPHLKFSHKISGSPRFPRSGNVEHSKISSENRKNRSSHSENLLQSSLSVRDEWISSLETRDSNELAPIDPQVNPIKIMLNPDAIGQPDFDLLQYNIEIVSEEDDGFIVAASLDNLYALEQKIKDFELKKRGSGKIADFWQIIIEDRAAWKPKHILSENLYSIWSTISDDQIFKVEVGIAFDRVSPKEPKNKNGKKYQDYLKELELRDELLIKRQSEFESFVQFYGEITNSYIDLEDSFSCQIEINGKGLKDLVENYPFVFEVNELEEVRIRGGSDSDDDQQDLEINTPDINAPTIGVIDSGIQENHTLISSSIDSTKSQSYVPGDSSTADYVQNGGHGTRVAGSILFPSGITGTASPYQLPCFIRNIRILDKNNQLTHNYPAGLMDQIISNNSDCSIFNLSINSTSSFRTKHMSSWASLIDDRMNSNDILFVISTGNITPSSIKSFLNAGHSYPDYLNKPESKIANPGQSAFALTVGSINHESYEDEYWLSIGDKDDISPFSRVGLGIWEMIKPDVVEYGGGVLVLKSDLSRIRLSEVTSPELIRSTLNGGPAYSKDTVGTSYAAPKVSYILAELKKTYPDESSNLLRCLIIQGARLPSRYFHNPSLEGIEYLGYGLPSLERVATNNEHRITFYNSGEIGAAEAHVYLLKIPDSLLNPADDYDILIEITLTFTARVRRTRQKLKSYLSNWLDWETSKLGESHDEFSNYILKELNGAETEYDKDLREGFQSIQWKLGSRKNWGMPGARRNNSTAQKDWSIIKSFDLPKEFSIAVRGHKGWDRNNNPIPYALSVSIEVLGESVPIYEMIRIENEAQIEV